MMRIAVYCGTFYPLHVGHLAVMRHLVSCSLFDMVYLIVSPQNPFKDAGNALTAAERYDAAVEAVSRHRELAGKVSVKDIELHMPPPSYTIRTLDALKEREPENDFTLVMGADNLVRFSGWKEWERIMEDYGIAVYPRSGTDPQPYMAALEARFPGKAVLLDAGRVDISSTEIRDAAACGDWMAEYRM